MCIVLCFCVFYLLCNGLAGEMATNRKREKNREAGNMITCCFILIYLNVHRV